MMLAAARTPRAAAEAAGGGPAPASRVHAGDPSAVRDRAWGDYVEHRWRRSSRQQRREHSLPHRPLQLFFPTGDEDWVKVSAPDDGWAHVIELGLQQEAGLRTGVQALAGTDFAQIGSIVTVAAGVTTQVYVTVGPGTTTLLRFWPYVGPGRRLELTIQLRRRTGRCTSRQHPRHCDQHRGNTPITGQFVNPFISATSQAIDDWYAVDLSEGTATLELLEAPLGGRFVISRQNEQSVSSHIQTPQPGVTGAWSFSVPTSGTYWIRFAAYTGFSPLVEGLKPSYLSQPYVFEVQQ